MTKKNKIDYDARASIAAKFAGHPVHHQKTTWPKPDRPGSPRAKEIRKEALRIGGYDMTRKARTGSTISSDMRVWCSHCRMQHDLNPRYYKLGSRNKYVTHWRLADFRVEMCFHTDETSYCSRPLMHDGKHFMQPGVRPRQVESPVFTCTECYFENWCLTHRQQAWAYVNKKLKGIEQQVNDYHDKIVCQTIRELEMEPVIETEDMCRLNLSHAEVLPEPATLCVEFLEPARTTKMQTRVVPCCEDCYQMSIDNTERLKDHGIILVWERVPEEFKLTAREVYKLYGDERDPDPGYNTEGERDE